MKKLYVKGQFITGAATAPPGYLKALRDQEVIKASAEKLEALAEERKALQARMDDLKQRIAAITGKTR